LPTLDALAAEQVHLAPGLREVARGDADDRHPRREIARAAQDMCVRVAFAADGAVHASLVDAKGATLADAGPGTSGALAPAGPVCVRSGDSVSLVLEASPPFRARYVAWASRS
jgi:hypothetical protein